MVTRVTLVLSRLLGRRPSAPARLSVVVPVFNVAPYLYECLESLAAQSYQDFDVVLVDDGSTDGSTALAEKFARRRAGWQLVHSDRRGPGGARNRGVEVARGEFLAFLDSDDLLLPGAYELMMSTLEASGSDFVVGSLVRFVAGERIEPPWIRRAHARRRLGTTLEEHPEILINVFPWSKVFRRSFYDRAGLVWAEGIRYEDQVFSTEAYLRAERFDVVRRPVYVWRVRTDGTSITQRRHELADLEDRVRTKEMTTDVVRRLGSPAVLDYWARNGLPGDLPVYFREIPGSSEDYWQLLHTATRDLFQGLPRIEHSQLPPAQRLIGWLVAEGRRADAESVLRWLGEHPGPPAVWARAGQDFAVLPFADDPAAGVPEEVFRLPAG